MKFMNTKIIIEITCKNKYCKKCNKSIFNADDLPVSEYCVFCRKRLAIKTTLDFN